MISLLFKKLFLLISIPSLSIGFSAILLGQQEPLPAAVVPDPPPFPAVVITTGGQRLLLEHTDARISYNATSGSFETNKPDWWFINYPVERIANLPSRSIWEDWIAAQTGEPSSKVKNWYFRSEGSPPPEPPPPTGPAPFIPTSSPTRVVNQLHPNASDSNSGTPEAPLKSINRALSGAKAGDVIHVYPGVYRESLSLMQEGTPEKPLRVEGIRGADGQMPVITGNDVIPSNNWSPVPGLPGVYRAPLDPRRVFGMASVDIDNTNHTLIERSHPREIQEGEYAFNRGSHRLLETIPLHSLPREGDTHEGRSWRRVSANNDGFIDLQARYGSAAPNSIIWMAAHVWIDSDDRDVVWHPDYPAPITGQTHVAGPFRAGRMTGVEGVYQANPYRMWLNGEPLQTRLHAITQDEYGAQPRVSFNWGSVDTWSDFTMQEGWNTIVLQLDTSIVTSGLRIRFGTPNDRRALSSANPPASGARPKGTGSAFISEFLILDPQPAGTLDHGIYVRLPNNADPRHHQVDVGTRHAPLLNIAGKHIHFRGFEIRHGANFQQRGSVSISGPANRLEACSIHSGETRGLTFLPTATSSEPLVVRNNWIFNHGNLGIGGFGRGSALVDYNVVADNNWGAYDRFWESGGMKLFETAGVTLRHNEVRGIGGPGIWLDWETFQNRVEGNFIHSHWGFGIGIEASAGPTLVANNLSVDMEPGWQWFRAHVLIWSSVRTWSLNNTINGAGKKGNYWEAQNTEGNRGLSTTNVNNRGSSFEPFPANRDTRYFNNIAIGTESALWINSDDKNDGNYTDYGLHATRAPLKGPDNPLDTTGYKPEKLGAKGLVVASDPAVPLIRHDFFGLLRLPSETAVPGAFRAEPELSEKAVAVLEVELNDGQMFRSPILVAPDGDLPSEPLPLDPSTSAPRLEIRRLDPQSVEISWGEWPEMSEIVLERSSDLASWAPLATFDNLEGNFQDINAPYGSNFFYRLRGKTSQGHLAISDTVGRLFDDWLFNQGMLTGTQNNPDGAASSLLIDYYLDIPPRSPTPRGWTHYESDGIVLRLAYERSRFTPDVTSRVLWSTNLIDWHEDGIVLEVVPVGDRERVEASIMKGDLDAIFLRFEVRRRTSPVL